jgi:hypothetical protein
MASPAFKAVNTPSSLASDVLSMTPPTPANDDYYIANVYAEPGGVTLTAPAGWTEIGTRIDQGVDFSHSIYVRRGLATDGAYNFGGSGSGITFIAGGIVSYTGVQTTGTQLQAVDIFSSGLTGTSTAPQGNGVTTSVTDTTLVYNQFNVDAFSLTPPSGMTERVDAIIYVADVALPTPGASGAKTGTISPTASKWTTRNIAIKSTTSGAGGGGGGLAMKAWRTIIRMMAGA